MNLEDILKESAPPTLVVDAGQSSILRTEVGKVPGVCTVIGNKATAIRMAWSYNNMLQLMDQSLRLATAVMEVKDNNPVLLSKAREILELVTELNKINVHVY